MAEGGGFFASLSTRVRELAFQANEEVKKAVSGSRFRFEEPGQYSLDLTYITDRIIAMGFPATGAESLYRNNAAHVCMFFDKYHKDKYRIINVSEINYHNVYFPQERICYQGWLDHHAPPMFTLLNVLLDMDKFLSEAPDHVLAVHCMAGKSRTGTVIACFLLFKKICNTAQEAITYFNTRRAQTPSLELPSQIRVVHMFEALLKYTAENPVVDRHFNTTQIEKPLALELTRCIITPVARAGISGSSWTPVIEVHNHRGFVANGIAPEWGTFPPGPKRYDPAVELFVAIDLNAKIWGDVLIKVFHQSQVPGYGPKNLLLFRTQFHTTLFLGQDPENPVTYKDFYTADLDTASNCSDVELQLGKLRDFPPQFRLRFLFTPIEEH